MTQTTEQERAEFEAWAGIEYRNADEYTKRDYDMGFAAWQASRRAQVAAVPQGWKLVPEKPTSAMLCALMQWDGETGLTILPEYKAMLAAAPQPPDAAQSNSLEFGGIKTEAAQGMDVQLVAFIEKVRDFKAQAVRVGSKEGEIRWDIEFGHYGAEVRGKTLREAIAKAIAAQAKKGGAA